VDYTITLTTSQAESASSAVSSIVAAVASSNPTFVQSFQSEAQALGVLSVALNTYLTASGGAPSVVVAASSYSFVVEDTTGPSIVGYQPAQGEQNAEPNTDIVLTFSESVQAGSGSVEIVNQDAGTVRVITIPSTDVQVSGQQLRIMLDEYLRGGTISVSLSAGAITDAPRVGSTTPHPNAGISHGAYTFQVYLPPPKQIIQYLSIGHAAGATQCSYAMTSPFYTCHDDSECTVFLKTLGPACQSEAAVQFRKISLRALQHIAAKGAERNGGDGRDTVLTYGGGQVWPEIGVADFAYA